MPSGLTLQECLDLNAAKELESTSAEAFHQLPGDTIQIVTSAGHQHAAPPINVPESTASLPAADGVMQRLRSWTTTPSCALA